MTLAERKHSNTLNFKGSKFGPTGFTTKLNKTQKKQSNQLNQNNLPSKILLQIYVYTLKKPVWICFVSI